jgi:hypothetical protein
MDTRMPRSRRSVARAQRGVSLIIAMLMLAVIGLASAAVIRNATSADRAVTNNRVQTQANQYAQLALLFCENQVELWTSGKSLPGFHLLKPTPGSTAWTVKANWFLPAQSYTLLPGDITGVVKPKNPPQCIAETTNILGVFTVTARGFSDDWAEDSNHATTNGSVVWLQSSVYL